jgi:hypothetical protein
MQASESGNEYVGLSPASLLSGMFRTGLKNASNSLNARTAYGIEYLEGSGFSNL